ncbi:MAG: hypothetical protein JNM18_00125 [Planctomycetaceae bacterium]|nr:hypothetical protein [Planctomycetaceae bacterium]
MSPPTTPHPAERFVAPRSIMAGVPLKEVLGLDVIRLIGESFASVSPKFDARAFVRAASRGLEALELNERGRHIGLALAEQLPPTFRAASRVLLAAFGPELSKTDGNGLAPFFYLPHAHLISERGIDDFKQGMAANYELTKRFTAEFSIRPFIVKYPDESLELLAGWTQDANPHVRRLVSEGTRPRLPWAMRLKAVQQQPQLTLPLLEALKDDPQLYVRRSVANHLADILKDHPDMAYDICERWLNEVSRKQSSHAQSSARKWIIRHAVRLPAKKGESRAVQLRLKAK